MEVLPELEPPFKTITGFTRSTVLPGTGGPALTAWAACRLRVAPSALS
jgi:hypothetical protein